MSIIEAVASIVLNEVNALNHPNLGGSLLDTKRKPHAIAVVLNQSILGNYWFTTLMEIYITLPCVI
jgi:hypothetical protein